MQDSMFQEQSELQLERKRHARAAASVGSEEYRDVQVRRLHAQNQLQSCKKYFPFWELGKRAKVVCKMKVLFTIAYIQYTIGLQLYLLKRYIGKVTESSFQAIKVSGDVEK